MNVLTIRGRPSGLLPIAHPLSSTFKLVARAISSWSSLLPIRLPNPIALPPCRVFFMLSPALIIHIHFSKTMPPYLHITSHFAPQIFYPSFVAYCTARPAPCSSLRGIYAELDLWAGTGFPFNLSWGLSLSSLCYSLFRAVFCVHCSCYCYFAFFLHLIMTVMNRRYMHKRSCGQYLALARALPTIQLSNLFITLALSASLARNIHWLRWYRRGPSY